MVHEREVARHRAGARRGRRCKSLAALLSAVLVGLVLAAASPAAAAGNGEIVLTWGRNTYGQLGIGTTTPSTQPGSTVPIEAHVPAGTAFTAVSGGYGHSVALTSTGNVYAWGQNDAGQLGDGTFTDSNEPVEVDLPAATTVLALTSTGHVLSWGYNEWGQLGNATTGVDSDVPVEVQLSAGTTVTAISAGAGHAVALTSTGEVLTWGDNDFGQLGDGTRTDHDVPGAVTIPGGATVRAIAGGDDHSLALTSTGTVLAWGCNGQGQLGNGTTTTSATPVNVSIPVGETVSSLAAGAGNYHSLAITQSPSSTTSLTADPREATVGHEVTFTAKVTCSTGAAAEGEVRFLNTHGDLIGTAALVDGVATLTVSDLAEGEHTVVAEYEGDATCPSSASDPVTVTVTVEQCGCCKDDCKDGSVVDLVVLWCQ